jgi:hypothetical protein
MCGGDVQTASVRCRKGMLTCRTRRGWAMCPGEFVGQHVVLRCCRAVGDSTAWRERDRDAQHASTRESRHPYRKTGYRLHAENAADETMAFPSQNQLPDCSLRSPWLHQTRAKLWEVKGGASKPATGGGRQQGVAAALGGVGSGLCAILVHVGSGCGAACTQHWQPTSCQAPPLARASPFLIRRMGIHGRDALPPRISSPSQPSHPNPQIRWPSARPPLTPAIPIPIPTTRKRFLME